MHAYYRITVRGTYGTSMDMTGARRVASRFLGRGVIDQLRSIEYRLPGWPVPSIHEPVLSGLSGTSDRKK